MSNQSQDSVLDNLLEELDVGHFRDTPAFVAPKVRHLMAEVREVVQNRPDFLPWEPPDVSLDRETEPLLPRDDFPNIVQRLYDDLIDEASRGLSLADLEEEISESLEFVKTRIDELNDRIELLEEIRDEFLDLAERYWTIDEAAEADALPDTVERRYELPPGTQFEIRNQLPISMRVGQLPDGEGQFEPFYDVGHLLREEATGLELEAGRYAHRGNGSPIRVATQAHSALEDLYKQRRPKRKAKVVGELRLQILKYIRRRYRITGVLPETISEENGGVEAENNRDSIEQGQTGGHPRILDQDELRKKALEMVGQHCDCWHDHDDQYDGVNKRRVFLRIKRESPDVVDNPNTDKSLDPSYVQSKLSEILEDVPEKKKQTLRDKACGDE